MAFLRSLQLWFDELTKSLLALILCGLGSCVLTALSADRVIAQHLLLLCIGHGFDTPVRDKLNEKIRDVLMLGSALHKRENWNQ